MRIFSKPLVSFLWIAALGLVATPAQAQLGLAAGLNFDSISDIETNSGRANFDQASGYHFGVFYDLSAGPIALRPGIFFRRAGDVALDGPLIPTRTFDLDLVEIPIDLRFNVLPLPILKPYVLAGPVFSFAQSDAIESGLSDLSVSATVGAGVQITIPGIGLKLFPEFRYGFGVTRFMEEAITIGGVAFDADDSAKLNSVMLRLGIGL